MIQQTQPASVSIWTPDCNSIIWPCPLKTLGLLICSKIKTTTMKTNQWTWSSLSMLLLPRSDEQINKINNREQRGEKSSEWAHWNENTSCLRLGRLQTCQGKVGSDSTFENLSWCGCTRLNNRWMLSCLTNEMRVCWFSVIEKKLILSVWDFPKLYNCYLLWHQQESIKGNKQVLRDNFKVCKTQESIRHTYKGITLREDS